MRARVLQPDYGRTQPLFAHPQLSLSASLIGGVAGPSRGSQTPQVPPRRHRALLPAGTLAGTRTQQDSIVTRAHATVSPLAGGVLRGARVRVAPRRRHMVMVEKTGLCLQMEGPYSS